jgi:hypothetical protein
MGWQQQGRQRAHQHGGEDATTAFVNTWFHGFTIILRVNHEGISTN